MFKLFFEDVDPTMPVAELTPKAVMDYVVKQANQRSGYAANKDRKNLVAAWNWGMTYMAPRLPAPNPCTVEKMPEIRHPRYVPPEEDFNKVYEVAEGQDRIILLGLMHLGARKSEIFRLKWDDLDFENGYVRLATSKRMNGNLEYDWIPMTDELNQELQALYAESNSEWVFINPKSGEPFVQRKGWLPSLCEKAEVKSFDTHSIRHLTSSKLADKNVPAIQIQKILRHQKLSTTERYLHHIGDLKSAVAHLSKKK